MRGEAFGSLAKGLEAIERTRNVGYMSVALLSQYPGWDKGQASRYLAYLAEQGWLERANPGEAYPKYVLGHKCLALAPDLAF